MLNERWLPVMGALGYEVSDLGRIRCYLSKGPGTRLTSTFRLVKATGVRYMKVCLCVDGKRKYASVHRLVLEAFVGPCPLGQVGRHRNSNDTKNNSLSNLAWGTRRDNEADKKIHGTYLRGEKIGTAKLTTDAAAKVLRLAQEGVSFTQIGREFGISGMQVRRIAERKSWAHIASDERALEDIRQCAAEQVSAGVTDV